MSTSSTNKLLDGVNADDPAVRAVIAELHAPRDLGEDRVVLAAAGIQPRPEPSSALAHDDRAAGHEVAVVRFDAEALRVGIASVAGAALSFFMGHCYTRMSLMRTRVYTDRCPLVRRMPLRRFFLKTRIFGPRASPSITATTRASAIKGAPATISPPSFSTSST